MELALSLGDTPKAFSLFENPTKLPNKSFCIPLEEHGLAEKSLDQKIDSSDPRPPIQLNLLPSTPVLRSQPSPLLRIPWLNSASNTLSFLVFVFYRHMLIN